MLPLLENLFKRKTLTLSVSPHVDALLAQAASAADDRDFDRSVQLYDEAIALNPAHAEAYYKRGNALRNAGRMEAAVASYGKAIEILPAYAHAYCNRGVAEQSLGLTAQALSSYDRAIALDSTDAVAHYNRALLMQELSRWGEALASYDRAIRIDPQFADAQYNRSLTLLVQGDFANGWRAYEWRWKNAQRLSIGLNRNFTQPLWLGKESIAGKRLLLYSEAGLGDTIQFCRYAKLCAELGATVILEVAQPLHGLLQNLPGVSELVVTGSALPPFDCHCPLMSLPLAFGTTLETIPSSLRYLNSDAVRVERCRAVLGPQTRPRVGLAWSGNPNNPLDARRSILLAEWAAHLAPEFQYVRLQKDVREADRQALAANSFIVSLDDGLLDFDNTAALCDLMDVVISVDTSVAHLSAALGRKTWLLLAFSPDWRWLQDRTDSPWYPSVRLYRQQNAGDWNEVFGRLATDLREQLRE
jgi:tetratricopeptide (TPR) repeat protein